MHLYLAYFVMNGEVVMKCEHPSLWPFCPYTSSSTKLFYGCLGLSFYISTTRYTQFAHSYIHTPLPNSPRSLSILCVCFASRLAEDSSTKESGFHFPPFFLNLDVVLLAPTSLLESLYILLRSSLLRWLPCIFLIMYISLRPIEQTWHGCFIGFA